MLIVRVELHKGGMGGPVTELARMEIINDGSGTETLGNYFVSTLRGRNHGSFDQRIIQRAGRIEKWQRKNWHVWKLVACALYHCGYDWRKRGKSARKELQGGK